MGSVRIEKRANAVAFGFDAHRTRAGEYIPQFTLTTSPAVC
jgi:hypothetical protein